MRMALATILVAACGSRVAPPEPLSASAPVKLAPVALPIVTSLTAARDAMCACRDAGCAHAEQAKLRAWSAEFQALESDPPEGPTATDIKKLFSSYDTCLAAAHEDIPEGSTDALECDVYEFRIIQISNCSELPRETRVALKRSFQEARSLWDDMPADSREALISACRQAAATLEQPAVSCET